MKARYRLTMLAPFLVLASSLVLGAEPAPSTVAQIQDSHDRALIRDMSAYIDAHPKADDLDQAYMVILNKAIEHDWFVDNEALANRYLKQYPDGPVTSLGRIVATMARAQSGHFDEALARFKDLMRGLGKAEQEEFAVNFADNLALAATVAGEYQVARQVYGSLLERFGESPALRQKVGDDLKRLDKVGKPAPSVSSRDTDGNAIRLEDYRGKYVLVDFWATWCAPCVAELPVLQAAYAKYHPGGFEVVGVSLDETKSALLDFVRERKLSWKQVHNASSGADLVEAFGVNTIPASFLIDPEGKVIRIELRGPSLETTLAKLLKPSK
ncbi:redoxin domain-containing protein [Singulisphaera rosea]